MSSPGHYSPFNDNKLVDEHNVFVKYLPSDLTEEQFRDLFKEFGEIISSKIMVDQHTGKSLGFGFVRFSDSESSQQAIKKMNGTQIQNKRLLCKLANVSQHNPDTTNNILGHQIPSNNLYIKPLLPTTTEEDLRKLFENFGNIITCKVMIDRKTGLSRQIGFVRFESKDEAKRALEEMTNYKLDENAPPLTVKYEDTKEQKVARKYFRMTPPNPRVIPVAQPVFMVYPASPPFYGVGGGLSYPPYPGYEYGYPFSPPNYYPPPFSPTPNFNHGEGFTPPGSPIYPYSWTENQPSPYGPGTAFPNYYSLSKGDSNDEDSLSDEIGVKVLDDDNHTPFPMFDDLEKNGEDNNENTDDDQTNGEGTKYKTKPISIPRKDS